MPILNYGLDWEWDKSIYNRHEMLGETGKHEPVDFYDQIGIYTLKKTDKIVYVGKACSVKDGIGWRVAAHAGYSGADKKGKWNTFSWFGMRPVGVRDLLKRPNVRMETTAVVSDIEALLIYLLDTKLNKARGKYKHMTEFFQCWP
jgi:hypothetical protein